MAAFLIDLFTEASATAIASHSPNTGGAWSQTLSFSAATVGAGSGLVSNTNDDTSRFGNAATPPSKFYAARVRGRIDASSRYFKTMVRQLAGGGDEGRYEVTVGVGSWSCVAVSAGGAATTLGSGTDAALTVGSFHTCQVGTRNDGSGNTLVDAWIDGVQVVTGVADSSSGLDRVGVAGFELRSSTLDWITAGDAADADPEGGDVTNPVITGPGGATGATSSISVAENTTLVFDFSADEAVTWDLNGGADVSLFGINSTTGVLSFTSGRNFESPTDANTDGIYVVGVRATDGTGNATTQTVSVTVTDADEIAPVITGPGGATGATSSISLAENITTVFDFSANETVAWSLNGGADVALFSINSSTGVLSFVVAPDFEAPADADTNNVYVVGVRATDVAGNATTQTVSVTVTNVVEGGDTTAPILSAATAAGGTLSATGTVATNEGNGTLYAVTCASATFPSKAQVKLGQDAAGVAALWAGNQPISSIGVKNITATPLAAGTGRYHYFMHEDAAGNQSDVVGSSSFTVSAGTGTFVVTMGPFARNTGAGTRAAGEVFHWWGASGVYIGGDWNAATRQRGTGTLNSSGQAIISGLTVSGLWEMQIRFPSDPGTEAQKGTARQTVTAA